MYKLEIDIAPDSDISLDEFDFVVNDLVASIPDRLPDVQDSSISRKDNSIWFSSSLSENEIRSLLKPVFSHHFDILRLLSLEKF